MAIKYSQIELAKLAEIKEKLQEVANPSHLDGFVRKEYVGKASADLEVKDGAREFIAKITTSARDRDDEIVNPDGIDFSQFRKNPVILWAHNYIDPPIGKAVWIKPWTENRKKLGYLSMGRVAQGSTKAQEIFNLMQEGVINTVSIGFISIAGHEPTEDEIKSDRGLKGVRYIHDKVMMLEYSLVNVPANPEATIEAVSKGDIEMSVEMQKDLKLHVPAIEKRDKKAIPYLETPRDGIESGWSLSEEKSGASTDDLAVMAAWMDNNKPDNTGSYKFIHHRSTSGYPLVWEGLAQAMSSLQNFTVKIPDADRLDVYKHLSKHYSEFGRTPPEFVSEPVKYTSPKIDEIGFKARKPVKARKPAKQIKIKTREVIPVKKVIDVKKLSDDIAENVEINYLGRV